ncbi:MAG: hypothetical protein WDW36_002160 [Sanguina aurantia]
MMVQSGCLQKLQPASTSPVQLSPDGPSTALPWTLQISKLLFIPFVASVEYCFMGRRFTTLTLMAILTVLCGVAIVTVTDLAVNPLGLAIAAVSVVTSGLQQILCGTIQREHKLTSNQLLANTAPIQGVLLLLVGPYVDQRITGSWIGSFNYTLPASLCLGLSCCIAVLVNISQFMCLGRFSAVTFQVMGHSKTVLVLLLSWLYLDDKMTARKFIGMAVAIAGMVAYGYANSLPVPAVPTAADLKEGTPLLAESQRLMSDPAPATTDAPQHSNATAPSTAAAAAAAGAAPKSPHVNGASATAVAAASGTSPSKSKQPPQQQQPAAPPTRQLSQSAAQKLNGQEHPAPASPSTISGRGASGTSNGGSNGSGYRSSTPAPAPGRIFEEHLADELVRARVLEGGLLQGPLRVNSKDATEGFVSVPGIAGDVQVRGSIHQNRALPGDVVALQMLPLSKWWEVRGGGGGQAPSATPPPRPSLAQEHPWSACTSAREVLAVVAKILSDRPELRVKAKVVSIVRKCAAREQLVGVVRSGGGGGGGGGGGLTFVPLLPHLPHMSVKESEVAHQPEGLLAEAASDEVDTRTLMCACLVEWLASSSRPTVSLRHSLGQTGQIESETAAILEMEGIRNVEFSPAVLQCLPAVPWVISEEDMKGRRDFRDTRVFTIDPPTAKDLDDALHITPLPGGGCRVGVHIADVAHFIPPFSALDVEAGMRATSVYLTQRVIPMLPPLLCEQLCSLNPGVDRLAFSVVWDLDAEGQVVSQWAGRSIICSCAKLAYPMVQAMIEGRFQREACTAVLFGFNTWDEVIGDSLALNAVACKLRAARFRNGALTMDNIKLSYVMDKDGDPVAFSQYIQSDANHLVEEFMLLANMSVATLISDAFPDRAMLRRHEPPRAEKLVEFAAAAKAAGLELDLAIGKSLQEPLTRVRTEIEDKGVADMLMLMATRPMQLALYFSTGEQVDPESWAHYALAVEAYTHFTSPIRRYPDVVVHRLLAAALDMRESGLGVEQAAAKHQLCSGELTGKVAEHCNEKRLSAREAQDASQKLYLAVMTCKRPAITSGVVMQLKGDKFFNMYLPEYGVICKLQVQDLGVPFTSSWRPPTSSAGTPQPPPPCPPRRRPLPDFAPWVQSLPPLHNPNHTTPVVLPLHLQLTKTFPVVVTSVMRPGVPSELIARIYLDVGLNLAVVANETAAAHAGRLVPSCIPLDVLCD